MFVNRRGPQVSAPDSLESRRAVAVLGHFPSRGLLTGQTIRTRLLFDELRDRLGCGRVTMADTAWLGRRPLRTLRALRAAFERARDVLILPGPRGLSTLLPHYCRWRGRHGNRIHYMVVGGWLPGYLRERPRLIPRVRSCDGVYVQSRRMARELDALGIERVHVVPNFRAFRLDRPVSRGHHEPLRLVFLSRVIPEKGVELAIEAVEHLNRESRRTVVELDIWGPVAAADRRWFDGVMGTAGPDVRYRGFLDDVAAVDVLPGYDALVFPTSYFGEGFPGVVVEAFAAGLPVVASDWQDNLEVVRAGHDGLVFPTGDAAGLRECLRWLIAHPREMAAMKQAAAASARSYHVDVVIPPLLELMGLT